MIYFSLSRVQFMIGPVLIYVRIFLLNWCPFCRLVNVYFYLEVPPAVGSTLVDIFLPCVSMVAAIVCIFNSFRVPSHKTKGPCVVILFSYESFFIMFLII
jgi:hypothetical protein